MKKAIIALVALVVLGGGAAFFMGSKNDSGNNKAENAAAGSKSSDTQAAKGKPACELLTLEDAKSLLGANAVLADGSGEPNLATTENVDVDNCTYSAEGATIGDFTQVTVQRHFGDRALVTQAYENFKKEYPGEAVSGLGDRAYYATEGKHVEVLTGSYWIHIGGGSINAGDAGNKDMQLKAAKLALDKL